MKKLFSFLIFILIFIFIFLLNNLTLTKKINFVRNKLPELLKLEKPEVYLFLGKMGYGYQGGENTDSIFVVYLKNNKAYFIYIPRDLIIKIDNDFYKINSLYSLKKIDQLLLEISKLTGLKIQKYIVFDIHLIKKIVDILGGLEVNLIYSVTDAVSGYTLSAGPKKLNSEWVEFVIRSRYYPQGDFARMKNQFIIIQSLKKRLKNISVSEYLKLTNLIFQSERSHIETNLNYSEILNLINKLKNAELKDIILDFNSNLWIDDYFQIKINNGNYFYVSGLIPKDGIGKYDQIRERIKKEIAQKP